MYNRYMGNSGKVQRVYRQPSAAPPHRSEADPGQLSKTHSRETRPPSPLAGLSGELGRVMGKLASLSLESEDILLIAVLYLLYRDSGDTEFLIMIGALLLL